MHRNITLMRYWKGLSSIMRHKALFIALFVGICTSMIFAQTLRTNTNTTTATTPNSLTTPEEFTGKYGFSKVNPDEYFVKYGDVFFIQSLVADSQPVRSMVMASGVLSLYPFADTVMVAGKKLSVVLENIEKKIGVTNKDNRVLVHLENVAPLSFSIKGGVENSGTYFTERAITLNEAFVLAGGLLGTASRKVTIIRDSIPLTFDMNKLYTENNLAMNPLINQDDLIIVDYAQNYVRVFASNDTLSYVEYVELQNEKVLVKDILAQVSFKHRWSNVNRFTVERDGVSHVVDKNYNLQAFDDLFISVEELYVYVTGYVVRPGRFAYNGNVDINYYLSQAGGSKENGSLSKLYIIREHGKRVPYKNQIIRPGDTIYVPESTKSAFISYLTPVATVVSVIVSIIILSRS